MTPSSRKRPRRPLPLWVRELPYRFYPGAVARELNRHADWTDRDIDLLGERIAALEEIIAAGPPDDARLTRALRDQLRATDAQYAEAGPDFLTRRLEWAAHQAMAASQRAAQAHGGRGGK